jgi:hypothetical protein
MTFAIALTYLDVTKISTIAIAGTFSSYVLIIALETIRCYYSRNLQADDKHFIHAFTKLWFVAKGLALFVLLALGLAEIRIKSVRTWELVLVVLCFEGVWYTFLAFDPPRNVLMGLRHAFKQVACLLGMILLLTLPYALLGCLLFRNVTPEKLQQDGVLGPETLFTDFLMSCLTLWQVAQADNIGAVTRAFERISPGSCVYFVVWNFIMFYLFANAVIATLGSDYYASSTKDPSSSSARTVQAQERQLSIEREGSPTQI